MRQDLYNESRLFIIQRKVSFFVIIITMFAIISNLTAEMPQSEKLFNILTVIPFAMVFTVFYFINRQGIRIAQIALIIFVGCLSTLAEKRTIGAGNGFTVWGCLLLYRYGVIEDEKRWHEFALFFFLCSLNLISIGNHKSVAIIQQIILSALPVFIVFVAVSIYKEDIERFNKTMHIYNAHHQIGMQAVSVLNDLNCGEIADQIDMIIPPHMIRDNWDVRKRIRAISETLAFEDSFRQALLDSLKMNVTTEPTVIDISFGIINLLHLSYDMRELRNKIEFSISHKKGICINCIPHELYYLMQNILGPIINLLLKEKEKNKLTVMMSPKEDEVIINIFSTGPGIKKLPPSDKEPVIDLSLDWSRSIEYFQFADAREMAQHLDGQISFSNRDEGGLDIVLKLPICHEESPLDKGTYNGRFNW